MAIKNIIAQGIGFSPGSVKFLPTLGFSIGSAILLITLPSAAWDGTGQAPEIIVKNVSSSSKEIQLDPFGSETIDDELTVSITAGHGRIHIISDRVNWMRVD